MFDRISWDSEAPMLGSDMSSSLVKRHPHYLLYQKRYNRVILDISYMSLFDKIRLQYIS